MIEYAYIETTNHCNLQCSFCNRHEVIGDLQHMSVSKFKRLLDKIAHHPIKEAKLMGMGEPFLHPEFNVICKTFKDYFPNARLISATNCQYSMNVATWFPDSLKYIDYLYLSIDGYKETYERDRSPSKWSKLIKFLDELQKVDRHDCQITCNYVVNPSNIDDIQKVYDEIVLPYNLTELRLNIAQDWSETRSVPLEYTDEQLTYLKTKWQSSIKGRGDWNFKDCFWVKTGLYATVEGRILACCMNTAAKSFGNIFEKSIEDIHNGIDFQNVKQGCLSNTPTKHCASCSYKELAPVLTQLGV